MLGRILFSSTMEDDSGDTWSITISQSDIGPYITIENTWGNIFECKMRGMPISRFAANRKTIDNIPNEILDYAEKLCNEKIALLL